MDSGYPYGSEIYVIGLCEARGGVLDHPDDENHEGNGELEDGAENGEKREAIRLLIIDLAPHFFLFVLLECLWNC